MCVLLLCCLHSWADDSLVDSINDIKRNMAFVYGEATEESRQSADSLARTDLLLNIQEWVFKNTEQVVNEEFDKRISRHIRTISMRRADKIRVFVYVQKFDVMPLLADISIHFSDSTAVDVLHAPTNEQVDTEKLLATSKKLAEIFAQSADKPKTRNEVLNKIYPGFNYSKEDVIKRIITYIKLIGNYSQK